MPEVRVPGLKLRRAAGVAFVALLATTGCLPSVLIDDPMPMSIHRDESGALTVAFPVCAGDRVSSVGVGARFGDEYVVLRYGPASERQTDSSVETFVVDDASVAKDELDVPWPVSEMWPIGIAPTIDSVTSVWASTTTTTAGADLDTLMPSGASDWLVTGDRVQHDAVPVAVSGEEAEAAVEGFCAND